MSPVQAAGNLASPVFVLGAPCSGAGHLRNALSRAPGVVVATEIDLVEIAGAQRPPVEMGDRLAAGDLGDDAAQRIRAWFRERIADAVSKTGVEDPIDLRLLAGSAREALQISLIDEVFPDARFVFTWRDPIEALGQMTDLWRDGRAVTHPALEGWSGPPWSLPLIPGWQELDGRDEAELITRQWIECLRIGLDALEDLPPERWCLSDFLQLTERPEDETQRICRFLDLGWFSGISTTLMRSIRAEPNPGLFEIPKHMQGAVSDLDERARDYIADTEAKRRTVGTLGSDEPLRSVHTRDFPGLIDATGGSLLMSTYQTGRLILVRHQSGGLNTHFRGMDRPMGIASAGDRLVIGARTAVHEYRDMPVAAERLEPAGSHDACFLPRLSLFTGDVAVHDVGIGGSGEIWLVATKLSCLATLDGIHSLVPRWTPPFITEIAGGDRCHLNGMAMVEGLPRYVTMLGKSDRPGGWRENKATDGLIMDVRSGEVVAGGLSMPHSPRWHDGRLFFLESGHGRLCAVDPDGGARPETVAELPGFTRGLSFFGNLAFVGLSQIRETATFGGLPLSQRTEPLESGVWVVDLESGKVVGFLRFEGQVQEIFDVAFISEKRFPEVAEHNSPASLNSFDLPE